MNKASFVLYVDIGQHLGLLSDVEAGQLFKGIVAYAAGEPMPQTLSPAAQMAFSFIRAQLDRDSARYAEVCAKRREAGRLGAAATNGKRSAKAANAERRRQNPAKPAENEPESEPENEPEPDKIIQMVTATLNSAKAARRNKGRLRTTGYGENVIRSLLAGGLTGEALQDLAERFVRDNPRDVDWFAFEKFCDQGEA